MRLLRVITGVISTTAVVLISSGSLLAAVPSECPFAAAAKRRIEAIEQCDAEARLAVCYDELTTIARTLYEPSVLQLRIRAYDQMQTRRAYVSEGEVWFSRGDLFARIDDQRYATIGGNVYEWKSGENKGRILTRYCGDTLDFLFYLADPSELKATAYDNFRNNPSSFDKRRKSHGVKVIRRNRDGAWVGVEFQSEPFWLRSLLFWDAGVNGEYRVLETDRPIARERVPIELLELPPIEFVSVSNTLQDEMEYL